MDHCVVMGDIAQMFHSILLENDHRGALCSLGRNNLVTILDSP